MNDFTCIPIRELQWEELNLGVWPCTTDYIKIIKEGRNLVVEDRFGTKYALNGVAEKKYRKINEIWRSNPEIPGTKMSLTPMIDFAISKLG